MRDISAKLQEITITVGMSHNFFIKAQLNRTYQFQFVFNNNFPWYPNSQVITMEIEKARIGKRIKYRRREKGLSQEQLAEKMNLSKNHISNLECGKSLLTTAHLMNLCDVLGGTPNYYLLGESSPEAGPIQQKISQMSPKEQVLLCKLLDVYLEESGE